MDSVPRVSIVTLNLNNGPKLLAECFDALAALDYPQEQIEVILVDNGSTDGAVSVIREAYPWVRIFEAGRNLGFAGGNNQGARIGTGKYLALINNDARADRNWLRTMVDALEADPEAVCAASKMLDLEGKRIDFAGTGMNLYGRGFQIDEGLPAAAAPSDTPREVLAPCGGAMMVRRDLFLEIGGFDEDFVIYYEDVDLGWRLWLLGYKVLYVPASIAYHRQHATGGRFPVEQLYTLSETNALRLLIKNCEEKNFWQVLPFSLFMGVKRSVEQAGLDLPSYQFGQPASGDSRAGILASEKRMTRVATSFLVAMDQIADDMPRLLEKRRQIQAARVRSDDEIFGRFPMKAGNPIFPWRRYHVVQDQLVESLGVADAIKPQHGSRLLIITHETIGPKMAGPGIRAWEMACALSEQFDVVLAAPGTPARSHEGMLVVGYETDEAHYPSLRPYLVNADIVLAMGPLFAQIPALQDLGKPTIVDLYDPFELEKLAQSPTVEEQHHLKMDLESTSALHLAGVAGDFFVCASERQRDFWLGTLLASGRVNTVTYAQDPTLRKLIDIVPFGIPSTPPQQQQARLKGVHPGIGADDKLLLWNGGLWQWFDPLTLLDALAQVLATRDDVKLFFAAGTHFDPDTVPEMPIYAEVVARCRELNLLDRHVFFGDWLPYDERADYLIEADLGVSIHHPGLESHFASRSRLLDCAWAGLPIVSTAGDPLSDLFAERGLGRAVPPSRPDLLAEAILEMLEDENLGARVAQNAQAVREAFAWARCVEPIAGFVNRAAFAPDALNASRQAAQARELNAHVRHLEQRIEDLEQEQQKMLHAWKQERQTWEQGTQTMNQTWEQEYRRMQDQMEERVQELEEHLQEIRQGKVMRLMRAVNVALGRE